MIKIKVGNYVIESNGRSFEVYKPAKPGKDAKKQDFVKTNNQYYATMEAMLKCLPERLAMTESNATTLEELLRDVKIYHSMIENNVSLSS